MARLTHYEVMFFCIQPLTFRPEDLETYLHEQKSVKFAQESSRFAPPTWLDYNTHTYFDDFQYIPIEVDIELFIEDLKNKPMLPSKLLASYIVKEDSSSWLFFNEVLKNFILVYSLKLHLTEGLFKKILSSSEQNNFYTYMRNFFVRDSKILQNTSISNYANTVEHEAIALIKKETSYEPIIPENTGNITFFHLLNSHDDAIIKEILKVNYDAEKIPSADQPINIDEHTIYSFNGRFHSIICIPPVSFNQSISRYFVIQFHMQYIWYYETSYLSFCRHVYRKISSKTSFSLEALEQIIFFVETLKLKHEEFKFSIENDYENIFKKIEPKWNVEGLMETLSNYLVLFKENLESKTNKKIIRSQKIQNFILTAITVLQAFALVSVWTDYLSLLTFHDELSNLWPPKSALFLTNILSLPILTIVVFLIVYFFYRGSHNDPKF